MDWRFIVDGRPRGGAENMAVDQALHESVRAGAAPALRLYRWARPCLSLGRNQPVGGLDVAPAAAARGVDVVRRPTGGGAVYHDRELTYAVAVPVGVLGSPRATYAAIGGALVEALRRLGVPAESVVAGGAAVREPAAPGVAAGAAARAAAATLVGPCFRAAAPGEVGVGGRKLVGSAQRREGRGLLQHGSLLLEGDQREAAELLGIAAATGRGGAGARAAEGGSDGGGGIARVAGGAPGVANLRAVLGYVPAWDALVDAVRVGFEAALGLRLVRGPLSAAEAARAESLVGRFRSDVWTWRR